MNLSDWQAKSESFVWNQHEIFVKDSGELDKPVLMLIHGFPTASIDWQPLWDALCEQFRCISLDLLGFGLSAKPKRQAITLMQQADICSAILTHKQVQWAHLLCHDYGDSVGQELLARAHEPTAINISSCIFLNGGLFPDAHRPRLIQKLLQTALGPLLVKLISYSKFAKAMRSICTQQLAEEDLRLYWDLLNREEGRALLPELIKYMSERKAHASRWEQATKHPPCPTRLINGVDDPISGEHLCDVYEQRVSQADVLRLKNLGHYPHVEAPQRVLEAAQEFWAGVLTQP